MTAELKWRTQSDKLKYLTSIMVTFRTDLLLKKKHVSVISLVVFTNFLLNLVFAFFSYSFYKLKIKPIFSMKDIFYEFIGKKLL